VHHASPALERPSVKGDAAAGTPTSGASATIRRYNAAALERASDDHPRAPAAATATTICHIGCILTIAGD